MLGNGESSILPGSRSQLAPELASGEGMLPNSVGEEGRGSFIFVGKKSSSACRWSREETLELVKIRSEMDVAFRDSAENGPLWEEVSRKMAELGYPPRSGKNCREKFDSMSKHHKNRTMDGSPSATARPSHSKSKTFEQLEDHDDNTPPPTIRPPLSNKLFPFAPTSASPRSLPRDVSMNSPSSSMYSDRDMPWQRDARNNGMGSKRRKKRKVWKQEWTELLEKLMGEFVRKQQEWQKNLFDVIDRRERERVVWEEAWRAQELARIDHEREMLAHKRSVASAKDNAVISFLQTIIDQESKISLQQKKLQDGSKIKDNVAGNNRAVQFLASVPLAAAAAKEAVLPVGVEINLDPESMENGEKRSGISPARWPKNEREALIKLRTNLDVKYVENTPKGPLWEEISAAMKKLGYNRNPKRCKEKWENINKYFKKVKESNKKRRDDSKTCTYFELLDEVYKQKTVCKNVGNFFPPFQSEGGNGDVPLLDAMRPLKVTPEQQWPPPAPPPPPRATSEQESTGGETDEDGDGWGISLRSWKARGLTF